MAEGKNAYHGRESTATRNPHAATKVVSAKELAKLSPEDRVLAQWRAASGNPISDEAKTQFCIHALGKTYTLADVRLWKEHHNSQGAAKAIYLEFFFDGSPEELGDQQEVFTKAFETMIEQQLQEQRVAEFREKLARRRRGGGGGEETEGGDEDWRSFLKKPIPATELSVRSLREAGCMLRFLVCQTSLSISASEVLGQITFQEHFPIDGVEQEPSKSTKPLPRWVYGLAVCTVGMTLITITAWYQVVKQVAFTGGDAAIAEGAAAAAV
eukprot:TRINITY_DN17950_c0_g2_i4.p1 TRINITY_DN17950_c0_g2~~TRINITY_DN17950_c0_g2_i4.p1  ORF type:complete len:269 (+),score=61.30 TRINITY_DN17950_c0_g2_i4:106-912(+)